MDVGHGGCGIGMHFSVTVDPLNGKTIREINYQYMVDVQSNAGTESERCSLEAAEWF